MKGRQRYGLATEANGRISQADRNCVASGVWMQTKAVSSHGSEGLADLRAETKAGLTVGKDRQPMRPSSNGGALD